MGSNYQKEMEQMLAGLPEGQPLLLHSCCAPCSSAVLEVLASRLSVTLFYYNPNIWPQAEYLRRRDEQQRLLRQLPVKYPVQFVEGAYDPERFLAAVAGLEEAPEGGDRCAVCFSLRLAAAAQAALDRDIGLFTTTLTVSPHKNAALLNEVGSQAAQEAGIQFLPSDFKKQDGYKRSLQLSAQYGLYRQQYCGCRFSCPVAEGDREPQPEV